MVTKTIRLSERQARLYESPTDGAKLRKRIRQAVDRADGRESVEIRSPEGRLLDYHTGPDEYQALLRAGDA